MLIVLCAAATLVVSALAVTEASQATISNKAPPTPHPLFGYTYDADGVTALPGCDVILTNLNTSEVILTTSDATLGIWSEDAANFPTPYEIGNIINVTATKGLQIGWAEAPLTDTPEGYDQIDVTLDGTGIPEFPMLILPIGGMIALFAVVSLKRKSKKT
jgi:hypothetical protein